MKKYEEIKFKNICETCLKYLNDREIVLLGESQSLKNYFAHEYNITISKVLTQNAQLLSAQPNMYRHLNDIKDMSEKYYIIIPFLKYDEALKNKLNTMGYSEYFDFIFFNHKSVVLGPGVIDYCDEYGNSIHTIGGVKVNIAERGHGNVVNIVSKLDGLELYLRGNNSYVCIEKSVHIDNGAICKLFSYSEITIKKKTSIASKFRIDCHSCGKLLIDEDCQFSYEIEILIGDGHSIFDVNSKKRKNSICPPNISNRIVIGKHVWIGYRCIILSNTVISDSSIIGAASLVKGKYPNNCIVAGNPARIIRRDVSWARDWNTEDISMCGEDNINLTHEIDAEDMD